VCAFVFGFELVRATLLRSKKTQKKILKGFCFSRRHSVTSVEFGGKDFPAEPLRNAPYRHSRVSPKFFCCFKKVLICGLATVNVQ
jgi:hypothetical protein